MSKVWYLIGKYESRFYKSERAIKTVSSAQARKPIYKSSIKSYENYKYFLADFFSKLEKKV